MTTNDNYVNAGALITGETAKEEEKELDFLSLFYLLMDKLHLIILCAMLGALLFNAFSYFLIQPKFQSTAKIYVVTASKDSVVDISDLNIGTSLTSDYEELILSYPVLNRVIDEMDLKMDTAGLKNMIDISNPEDTRILNITVTSTDAEQARDVANTLMNVAIEYLPKTMSTNPPNIAQKAILADRKSSPSYSKATLLGGFFGIFLICAFQIGLFLLDDTIHTADDMEKSFGIVPLTTIPESDVLKKEAD